MHKHGPKGKQSSKYSRTELASASSLPVNMLLSEPREMEHKQEVWSPSSMCLTLMEQLSHSELYVKAKLILKNISWIKHWGWDSYFFPGFKEGPEGNSVARSVIF